MVVSSTNRNNGLMTFEERALTNPNSEHDFQRGVFSWLRRELPTHVCTHPRGNSSNRQEGAKWKALGVLPGVPDVLILTLNVAIELKTNTGRLTKPEAEVMSVLEKAGWKTLIARPNNWTEVAEKLLEYDKLRD